MAIDELAKSATRSTGPTPNPQKDVNPFLDVLASPFRGVEGAIQGIYDLADYATGDDLLPDYNERFLGRSQTFVGGLGEGVTQFLTGFIPVAGVAGRIGALTKVGKAGKKALNLKGYAAAGAVADFSVFQAQEQRLSNLIQAFPSLANPVNEYLAADDSDGELEGRFKNTIEGLGIGGLTDSLFMGVKALKRKRGGEADEDILKDLKFDRIRDHELLREDISTTEDFRGIIDKAFTKAFGEGIVNDGTEVTALEAAKQFNSVYQGQYKPLLEALIQNGEQALSKATLSFSKKGPEGYERSGFNSQKGHIDMQEGGARTFVHELLHATTFKKLEDDIVSFGNLSKEALDDLSSTDIGITAYTRMVTAKKEFLERIALQKDVNPTAGLADVYLQVVKALEADDAVFGRTSTEAMTAKLDLNTAYGLTNMDEFITEAFTNPEFRRVLMAMPSTNQASKTMFDQFMDVIKKMLGVNGSQASLLDDVFKYTDELVRDQDAIFDGGFDYLKSIDDLGNRMGQRELPTLGGKLRRFEGGFDPRGKGTRDGDGKDQAMRDVADSAIVEIQEGRTKPSSSQTSLDALGAPTEDSSIIMLARNGTLRGKQLLGETKVAIKNAHDNGAEFVVGDMAGVDSAFIDWLDELGADYTIYHTGDRPRIGREVGEMKVDKTQTPERGGTMGAFKWPVRGKFFGKDISEIPTNALKAAMRYNNKSVTAGVKNRIQAELNAIEAGYAPRVNFEDTGSRVEFDNKKAKENRVDNVTVKGSPAAVRQAEKAGEGVSVLRKDGEEHYGNPFSHLKTQTKDTIATKDLTETVSKYKAWLEGTDFTDVKQERRKWVLDQIDSGALDGKQLLYHSNQQPNHAGVLAAFIKQRRSNTIIEADPSRVGTAESYLRDVASGGKTPKEEYARYLRNRGGVGGKAENRTMRLREYTETQQILRGEPTTNKNPRIQGKSQRSSDLERAKGKGMPDSITDARERGRAFSSQYSSTMGQRGFESNTRMAVDALFSNKKYVDKNGKIAFSQLFNALTKVGPKGTKEELEFLGFDAYFKGGSPKDKISKEDFDDLLNDMYNHEFREVSAEDLDFETAKLTEEGDGFAYDVEGERDLAALKRKKKINLFANHVQYGNPENIRGFILRDVGTETENMSGYAPSTVDFNKKTYSNAGIHYGTDVIYHIRTSDRVNPETGGKVLYIEEIQSDLLSGYRKSKQAGKDVSKLNVPFKKGYENNAARQAIKLAAEQGYDEVWLPSGDMIQKILGNDETNFGFYDTTHKKALLAAAKNLDPKFTELKHSDGEARIEKQIEEEAAEDQRALDAGEIDNMEYMRRQADGLDDVLMDDRVAGIFEEQAFEGGFGIKISDEMRAKAPQPQPVFGQRQLDQNIEESIARMANDLETGGDGAIANFARGIRNTTQAVALVQAIAKNLEKAPTAKTVSAEELIAENADVIDTLGGNAGDYAATIGRITDQIDLSNYRNVQNAVYKLMDVMTADVVDLANQADEALVNPKLNKQQLEVQLLSTLDQMQEVGRIWSLMGREAGLTLVQRKFLLDPSGKYRIKNGIGFDAKTAQPKDYDKYVNENRAGTMPVEKMVQLLKGSKDKAQAKKNIKKAMNTAEETFGSKAMDVTMEVWMNSLLSGPTTQVVNLLGNSLTLAIRTIEQSVGAVLTGNPQLAKATLKYAFDMESFMDVIRIAGQTFKSGESRLVQGSKAFEDRQVSRRAIAKDGEGTLAKSINILGTVVNVPSRALAFGDEFFKQMNYRSYVKTNLAYDAMKKGAKSGEEVAEYVTKNFDNFITKGARAYNEKGIYMDAVDAAQAQGLKFGKEQEEFIAQYLKDNPFDETRGGLADAAKGYAEETTFTNDLENEGVIGTLSNTLNTLKNKGGAWRTLNFVIPFLRTPTNILKFSIDRTPLGSVGMVATKAKRAELTKQLMSEDPVVRSQIIGKLTVSTAATASILYYMNANKGMITGGGPPNRDELEALRMSGWRPYSIKIGGTYYSYQRADPIATVLGLFADIIEGQQYHDVEDIVSQDMVALSILSLTQNVTNKSYVKGLDTLLQLVRDPVGNFKPFAGNIVGGFAPTFFTQIQNMADERELKETRTIFDYWLKKMPIAQSTLPSRRNFLGEVITNTNSPYMTGVLNPIYFNKESKDPVDKELAGLQHGFSQPSTKLYNALEMRDVYNAEGRQAFDRYLELSGTTKIGGKTMRQSLREMVKDKGYQALPKESDSDLGELSPRIKAVQRLVRAYRRKGRYEMLEEFPELKDSIYQLQQDKAQYRLIQ